MRDLLISRGSSIDFRTHLAVSILVATIFLLGACTSGADSSPLETETVEPSTNESSAEPTSTRVSQATPTSVPTEIPTSAVQPTRVEATATATLEPVPQISYVPNQDGADFLMIADDHLYVGGSGSGFISRRELVTGESAGSIRGGRDAIQGMTFDGEAIWTSDFTGQQVRKVGVDGADLGRFDVASPRGITFGAGHIWVANKDGGTITKLDLEGNLVGRFEAGPFPEQIAFDGDAIWVTNTTTESVTRISTEGEITATVELGIGRRPLEIAADSRFVWVSNGFAFLTRIDTSTLEVREFDVGRIASPLGGAGKIALDGDHVWITSLFGEGFGTVTQLTNDGQTLARIEVGGNTPAQVVVSDETVYVGIDVGRQVAIVPPEVVQNSQIEVPDGLVEMEVIIETSGANYSGLITMPETPGPHPAAVFINGSGASSRDMLFTWPWGRQFAQHLAEQGVAVLSVDDRGIGRSTGRNIDTTLEERISDTISMVEFLKGITGIDVNQIGVVGFSEGGAIAAGVASQIDLSFVVSIAGPVAPHRELLPLQTERFLQAEGAAESYITNALDDLTDAQNTILSGEGLDELAQLIELGSAIILAPDYILGDPKLLLTPWYESFLRFDPGTHWSEVDEPVLAVFGDKDWAVPAEQNEPVLRQLFEAAGKKNFAIELINDVNHFFQVTDTGAVGEFSTNAREFKDGFLELISDWLKERLTTT